MKKAKKVLSILLSAILVMQLGSVCLASAATADYKIVSPYEDVIWGGENAWGAYKGSLHSHTTYSDADDTLPVMVNEAYDQDYDFLAISDHGITGVDWDEEPEKQILYTYQLIIDNPFEHLTTEEYEAIKNGTHKNRGKKMVPVLGANEFNNLSLTKNHVNGFFLDADKGNGFPGMENEIGYEQAIKYIHENGGLSHINHPGDWLGSNSNHDIVNDPESVAFFGDLILKYNSCLGIEVFNERNGTTGYDRILWDNLLMYCLPYGKNVIGFSNTDAHHTGTVDTSYSIFMMEDNTVENIKETMQSGAFFGITRLLRANDTIGPEKEIDAANTDKPIPMFNELTVDGHKINASVKECNRIQWIADGKIIKEYDVTDGKTTFDYTLDLDTIDGAADYSYVRVELFGEGGLCVSQALVIDDGSEPLKFEEETNLLESVMYFIRGTKVYTIFSELIKAIKDA